MPIDADVASRTVCNDYAQRIITGGKGKRCSRSSTCKFSHSLLDVSKFDELAGSKGVRTNTSRQKLARLEYYGEAVSGIWRERWQVTLSAHKQDGNLETLTHPLVHTDADVNRALAKLFGDATKRGFLVETAESLTPSGKHLTACKHHTEGTCRRGSRCPFNHSLFDVGRIERLIESPGWYTGRQTFFVIDYFHVGGSSPLRWNMSLIARSKADASGTLYVLPEPIGSESTSIHTAMRSLEALAEAERRRALQVKDVEASQIASPSGHFVPNDQSTPPCPASVLDTGMVANTSRLPPITLHSPSQTLVEIDEGLSRFSSPPASPFERDSLGEPSSSPATTPPSTGHSSPHSPLEKPLHESPTPQLERPVTPSTESGDLRFSPSTQSPALLLLPEPTPSSHEDVGGKHLSSPTEQIAAIMICCRDSWDSILLDPDHPDHGLVRDITLDGVAHSSNNCGVSEWRTFLQCILVPFVWKYMLTR
ncbi:hypothetical protein JAAARDRAFT_56582 [Jaapia argillacea MUCL 33604]|uniref:C3H1-type domain-containing protein n=1 Tax=Jaapia argillacea MUCL 33604 TaxID=933084 RepID=A0A067Q7V6_9AGAM|nr:hypothetical protein JAAARDRAFT_56582 [Jaapia argillacea MUCL 33604]